MREPAVAVFHHRFKRFGGAERVANALADALDADLYALYVSRACAGETDATPLRQAAYVEGLAGRLRRRLAVENVARLIDAEHVDLGGYDAVLTSGDYAHCYLPTDEQAHLHYLHTPNRDLYNAPEFRRLAGGRLRALKTAYFQWLRGRDQDHAVHVDRWLCNSEFVADRCRRFYDPDPADLAVVAPPVDWEALGPADGARGDHFLTVGRLVPAKRVGLLAEAFRGADERLLVAGSGPERDRLSRTAPPNVEFLGYVPDDRKRDLLRRARGFLFAGERECFGMSVAEALAAGTPVAGVAEGNVPNLVGEDDGVLVDPSQAAFREAVETIAGRDWDHEAIRRRARRYSRERFGERAREVVADALGARAGTRLRAVS